MEIIERSLYWMVSEDTGSKLLRLMFKFERRNFQEFREDYTRESYITYIFPNSFVLMK